MEIINLPLAATVLIIEQFVHNFATSLAVEAHHLLCNRGLTTICIMRNRYTSIAVHDDVTYTRF